jgi:hypothetical protein
MKSALTLAALGFISAVLVAAPVDAHHKPGHAGGPPWSGQDKSTGKDKSNDNQSASLSLDDGPPSGPGNSGAAHWCKLYWDDPDIEDEVGRSFRNHGDCVSSFARQHDDEKQIDSAETASANDNDGNSKRKASASSNSRGDLQILTAQMREDGSFRVRGSGAEDSVSLTELTGNGVTINVKDSQFDNDGDWVVTGTWACSSHDGTRAGRFQASDADESDRLSVTFPCGALH